jgi:alpha/beta superfamily hydrolase
MAEPLHRSIFVPGPAGRLEALFWNSAHGVPPVAAAVCHPHPLFGGTMHNKVVYQIARMLDHLGIPNVRFNFRGVGLSAGEHDRGRGEQEDVRAVLDFLAAEFRGVPLLVAGFSFGCWVGLRVGCGDSRVVELIGLGAPVNNTDMSYLAACAKPRILIQGELDQFGAPAKLKDLVESFPEVTRRATRVDIVPGADHFFVGKLNQVDAAMKEWLIERHPELAAKNP